MKKHIMIFLLIFFITIGFASVSTVLDIKGNVNLAENVEDFRIELTSLIINDTDNGSLISSDKQSFTFTGSGNDTISYTITNYSYQYDANIKLVCTPNDNILIEQIGELSAQNKITKIITSTNTSEITCSINVEKISRSEYAEEMCPYKEGDTWEFKFTGAEQEFVAPCDGNYKIETWGASGGCTNTHDYLKSNAGYAKGNIILNRDKKLFLQVGGTPKNILDGGYNGGGISVLKGSKYSAAGGGGATDVRLVGGEWNDFDSLKSRIIVAAGSNGSQGDVSSIGHAGGLIGYSGYDLNYGSKYGGGVGTQTSGGVAATPWSSYAPTSGGFGYGGNGSKASSAGSGGGGGSGYYGGGGGSGADTGGWGGGGGSSFISGHNGCDAISKESTSSNIIHTGQPNHYSGLVFTDTVMVDGAGYIWTDVKGEKTGMPTHDGNSTMTGNSGNGYAKITYLGN